MHRFPLSEVYIESTESDSEFDYAPLDRNFFVRIGSNVFTADSIDLDIPAPKSAVEYNGRSSDNDGTSANNVFLPMGGRSADGLEGIKGHVEFLNSEPLAPSLAYPSIMGW
jgi:hypothetical protein